MTYLGDTIYYDFEDNQVENDNGFVIGKRNGFITRRVNDELYIDLKCDWREQKFRRWLLSDDSVNQFINTNEDASSSDVMTAFDQKFLFTSELRSTSNPEFFYIIPKPEYILQNLNSKGKVKEFEASAKSTINAKDYPIFKLDENKNPVKVIQCKIDFIENTVFQGNTGTFNLDLNIDNASQIFNSTFTSYLNIENSLGTAMQRVISLDSIFMTNMPSNDLIDVNFLGYTNGSIANSVLENVVFGTPKKNSLLGPGPHESVGWINLNMIECRFKNVSYGSYTTTVKMSNFTVNESCVFFYSNKTNILQDSVISNSIFNNTIFRCLYNTINVIIIGMIIPKISNDETIYTIPKVLNSIELNRISTSGELYYEEEVLNGTTFNNNIYVWDQASNNWILTS